ncbi:MAG TPA: DUF2867 domain-containing protein [Gemmobacter sp.]|nr:DUF2867 domain-containing protein [Gemmobacter sp.]
MTALAAPALVAPALVAPRAALVYYDQQRVTLPRPLGPVEAWNRIMANPLPGMGLAFRLRDAISARFGVQRIGGFSGRKVTEPRVGERLDFFLVEGLSAEQMVLTARDRHLDVMISVDVAGAELAITASVVTHNRFGRAYMLPVAPAHRLIVWLMLRRLKASLGS